jgi:hypothetical protein
MAETRPAVERRRAPVPVIEHAWSMDTERGMTHSHEKGTVHDT